MSAHMPLGLWKRSKFIGYLNAPTHLSVHELLGWSHFAAVFWFVGPLIHSVYKSWLNYFVTSNLEKPVDFIPVMAAVALRKKVIIRTSFQSLQFFYLLE